MYLLGKSLVGLGHFLENASVLLGNDGADDQQSTDHQGTAISRLTNTFWIRPARMKLTKDTAATVSA